MKQTLRECMQLVLVVFSYLTLKGLLVLVLTIIVILQFILVLVHLKYPKGLLVIVLVN